jgi:hypothetical protein
MVLPCVLSVYGTLYQNNRLKNTFVEADWQEITNAQKKRLLQYHLPKTHLIQSALALNVFHHSENSASDIQNSKLKYKINHYNNASFSHDS